jgi:hypothetical protein
LSFRALLAASRLTLAARIRVAWTLADLADVARPTVDETSYALGLWLGVGR